MAEAEADWAAVVDTVLAAAHLRRAVTVFALAHGCGLLLTPCAGRAGGLVGNEIHFDRRAPRAWNEAFVARCVAQWALRWCGVADTPAAIGYVARALSRARPET